MVKKENLRFSLGIGHHYAQIQKFETLTIIKALMFRILIDKKTMRNLSRQQVRPRRYTLSALRTFRKNMSKLNMFENQRSYWNSSRRASKPPRQISLANHRHVSTISSKVSEALRNLAWDFNFLIIRGKLRQRVEDNLLDIMLRIVVDTKPKSRYSWLVKNAKASFAF